MCAGPGEFDLTNPLTAAVRLVEQSHSCTCSGIECEPKELAAGETARARLVVETTSKIGPFRDGGTLVFADRQGNSWRRTLYVEGHSLSGLIAKPGQLTIGPADVSVEREIEIVSELPLQPGSLSAGCEVGEIRVETLAVAERRARLRVRCVLAADAEQASGEIRVTCTYDDGTNGLLKIPVLARQEVALAVSPRVAPIKLEGDEGRGRVLLRGTEAKAEAIKEFRCQGFDVTWAVHEASARRGPGAPLAIDLRLTRRVGEAAESDQLLVCLHGGLERAFPVMFVAADVAR